MKKYLLFTTLVASSFIYSQANLSAETTETVAKATTEIQQKPAQPKKVKKYSKVKCKGGCLKMKKKGRIQPHVKSKS